jgi:hypothetical protein
VTKQQRGGRGAGRAPDRTTKADRREQARLEREQIQRRMRARRRNRTLALVGVAVVAVAVVVALVVAGGGGEDDGNQNLPGLLTTPGPWDANADQVAARVTALGLPPEGNGPGHHHARLWIYVSGDPFPVPANVGINAAAAFLAPLHTHDDTGLIHVESTDASFEGTLGEFFDVWGVRLTSSCIGGNCAGGDLSLRAYVNGEPYDGSPRDIPLEDQTAIALVFGTEAQTPDPIPDSVTFQG